MEADGGEGALEPAAPLAALAAFFLALFFWLLLRPEGAGAGAGCERGRGKVVLFRTN